MAKEPGLGTSERYLIAAHRAAGWLIARDPWEGKPVSAFQEHGLNGGHGDKRSSHQCRKPLPGLRCVLFVFAELAAVHDRGRCRARSHSGKFRQPKTIRDALRRRPLLGVVRPDRGQDRVRDLCGSPRGVPHLHARRCRMRHGAATAWAAAVGLNPIGRLRASRTHTA